MIRNFRDSFSRLFNLNNLYSFILIGILFVVQLAYNEIPIAAFLSFLLVTGAIFISLMKEKKLINVLIVYAAIAFLYVIYLTTTFRYVSAVVDSILIIWIVFTVLKYTTHENYTEMLKQKIIRMLIALVYVVVVYLSIYIVIQLANSLFDLGIIYGSWPFRLSNAIAISLGTLVLIYEKEEVLGVHSSFFKIIIGKILPVLTLLMAVLSTALLIRYYFANKIPNYMDVYYVVFILLFLTYILSELAGTPKKMRQAVGISMAISVASYSLYLLKENEFNTNYSILINIILASWLIYHVYKGAVTDWKLSATFFLITLILYAPPFGLHIYEDFRTLDSIKEKQETRLSQFQKQYVPYAEQNNEYQEKSVYFASDYLEKDLSIAGYNNLKKSLRLNNDRISVIQGGYSLELTPDKKSLIVKNNQLNIDDEINLYDSLNGAYDRGIKDFIIIENDYMIDILNYDYSVFLNYRNQEEYIINLNLDFYYK